MGTQKNILNEAVFLSIQNMFGLVEQKKIVYLVLCEEGKIIFALLNWKMHVTPPIETVKVPLGAEISP